MPSVLFKKKKKNELNKCGTRSSVIFFEGCIFNNAVVTVVMYEGISSIMKGKNYVTIYKRSRYKNYKSFIFKERMHIGFG